MVPFAKFGITDFFLSVGGGNWSGEGKDGVQQMMDTQFANIC